MKITELIAQHITDVFEGDNWTEVNIKNTLEDVDHIEATRVSRASYNTIAALLHHLSFYNDVVAMRLIGIDPQIDITNGFNVPAIRNEHEWQKLKKAAFISAATLAEAARNFPEEKLFGSAVTGGPSGPYKMLHGIAEHAHYHLGQMVTIKKLLRTSMQQHAATGNSL